MLHRYLDLVSAFVIPLLTVYLMGTLTGVHRKSGTIGLIVGVFYGILRLNWPEQLPGFLVDKYAAYLHAMLVTAGAMALVSVFVGWERRGALRREETDGWLQSSRLEASRLAMPEGGARGNRLPLVLGLGVILIGLILSFVVFW